MQVSRLPRLILLTGCVRKAGIKYIFKKINIFDILDIYQYFDIYRIFMGCTHHITNKKLHHHIDSA